MEDKETVTLLPGQTIIGTKYTKSNYVERLEKENAELKAENERLKEENKTLEQFLSKEPLALQALQKGYASYKESTDVFYQMVKKYKQTLQEIKAIVKQCINKDTCYDCEYCDDCYIEDTEIPTYDVCKLLIQKITKAESEG